MVVGAGDHTGPFVIPTEHSEWRNLRITVVPRSFDAPLCGLLRMTRFSIINKRAVPTDWDGS